MDEEMKRKKLYVWQLASFLDAHGKKKMSGQELAEHLNRNGFQSSCGDEFVGKGPGIYRLIAETHHWVEEELGLEAEAGKIAFAYVKPDGSYAWNRES